MTELLDNGGIASHVVRSLDDVDALEYGGARVEFVGSNVIYIPELNRRVLADMRFGSQPHESGLEAVVSDFLRPGSKEWDEFLSTRKVVKQPNYDSPGGRVVVTSKVFEEIQKDVGGTSSTVGVTDRRLLSLVQLLTDTDLQRSLGLTTQLIAAMKVYAVSDPDGAADRIQSAARRNGFDGVRVTAGKYSRSRAWAKQSIARWAATKSAASVSIRAEVIGSRLLLYGDSEIGKEASWHVAGPISAAQQVYQLFVLVADSGPTAVAVNLETELTVLNLDIADGNSYAVPHVSYHAGLGLVKLPDESSSLTMQMLSAAGRLAVQDIATRVEPVYVDGQFAASSVRVSDKYSLVNNHVFELGAVTIAGEAVSQLRLLSRDVWLVKRDVLARPAAWPLRDPRLGEEVVVCYCAESKLQLTSPMTVRTSNGTNLTMSLVSELCPGMSGGAVVALSDMALLGVYEGVGAHVAMATVFSQDTFADIYAAYTSSVASHQSAGDSLDSVYQKLRSRGLGRYVDVAMASVQPLYSRKVHVGLGYTMGSNLFTTCDPGVMPLALGSAGSPLVFEDNGDMRYKAVSGLTEVPGPMLYRKPNYYEKVVVIGRDEEGPYYSPTTRVVHIGPNSKHFSLEGFDNDNALPCVGGLVLSLSDAAVLGQYVRHTVTEVLGEVEFCVTIPAEHITFGSPGRVHDSDFPRIVETAFPMLKPGVWEEGMLEEVFTHSSAQHYQIDRKFNSGMTPLAYVGDSAIKLAMGVEMRALGVPSSRWQALVQRVQSNAVLSRVCQERGLDVGIVFGRGVSRPPAGSKVYADLLEALAGAVYLSETFDTFKEFCMAIGAVVPNADVGGVDSKGGGVGLQPFD